MVIMLDFSCTRSIKGVRFAPILMCLCCLCLHFEIEKINVKLPKNSVIFKRAP